MIVTNTHEYHRVLEATTTPVIVKLNGLKLEIKLFNPSKILSGRNIVIVLSALLSRDVHLCGRLKNKHNAQ